MKKLPMRVDDLVVQSFATDRDAGRRRGTVRGHGEECTCFDSCLCPTAYYQCGTGPATIYSCDYTYNGSCERTAVDCRDTSYAVCGTPPITPACVE